MSRPTGPDPTAGKGWRKLSGYELIMKVIRRVRFEDGMVFQESDTMTNTDSRQDRPILQRIARQAMLARGLSPGFPPQALAELDAIHGPATQGMEAARGGGMLHQATLAAERERG